MLSWTKTFTDALANANTEIETVIDEFDTRAPCRCLSLIQSMSSVNEFVVEM